MTPWNKNWKHYEAEYKKHRFDSYFFMTRREGMLQSVDHFQSMHFYGRFIPKNILYKFFRWYQYSKLGWFLNGRSLKDILFNWAK